MTWRRACATYGAAHFGKSLLWTGSDLLPLYLLVTVYRVDPMTAGLVFLIGLAVNALADFGIDSWLARHSRHAATLAGGSLVVSGASFPATVLLAPYGPWPLLAATLTFRMAYAGCDVPHNALLSQLGDTTARATSLARCRTVGTALASLLAAGAIAMGSNAAYTPFLLGIAAGGILIGSAKIPLLQSYKVTRTGGSAASRAHGLPMPFLIASVVGIVALGALSKAMRPLLTVGPRGYGLYTMASKLALGAIGLALAGGLGRNPTFTPLGYVLFVLATAFACAVTALTLVPRLTPGSMPGLRTG